MFDLGTLELVVLFVSSASVTTPDGSASTDRDGDELSFTWNGPSWEREGCFATIPLGPGAYEITLTVKDPSGHIDRDTFELTVVDK